MAQALIDREIVNDGDIGLPRVESRQAFPWRHLSDDDVKTRIHHPRGDYGRREHRAGDR